MKDKGFKMGILVAVIAMVVVVGIGYAAFTATLNINGTAKVEASSWNVHFASLGNGITTTNTQDGIASTATVVTEPTLTDTTINDWSVTLKTPGDSVSYEFNVVNDGSFDATLSSPTGATISPTPTCTSEALDGATDIAVVNAAIKDAKNVCNHLQYKIEYYDTDLNRYTSIVNASGFHFGTDIASGETMKMKLTLTYKDDVTDEELSKSNVTISNLGFSLVYKQGVSP